MKKNGIKILVLLVLALSLTGCFGKMKNPKTVDVIKGTNKMEITFPDNKDNELMTVGSTQIIKNAKLNYKIICSFENRTIKEQNEQRKRLEKGNSTIIKDVNFNGYKGYAQISKITGSSQIYLYVNKKDDVVFSAKLSSVDLDKRINELLDKKTGQLKKGKKAEDALFNVKEVQEILKTVKYSKVKANTKVKEKAKAKSETKTKSNTKKKSKSA